MLMAKTTKKLHREYNERGELVRKECRPCGLVYPIEQFYVKGSISKTNIDGYQNFCIECHKAQWRKRAEDPKARTRWLLERIRSKCRKESIEFNLTIDDLVIPDRCPILGMPLRFGVKRNQSYRGPAEDSPSVDRIDPSKGYTKGNVVVISWRANRIKMNATPTELRLVADFYAPKSKG